MNQSDLEKIASRYPLSESTKRRNQTGGVPPDAEPQRDTGDESVATKARKGQDSVRHLVRLKSYRTRLCDERNLYDKYFVDALIYAGAIRGDSTTEAQVEVSQEQVESRAYERTELSIEVMKAQV